MQIFKSEFFHISKVDILSILVIVGVGALYLIRINTGIISVEPDEANHVEVLRSLQHSIYPSYFGIPFFYSFPLYPFISMLVSLILKDPFLSLRVTSLFATVATSLVVFFYLKFHFNSLTGLFGGLTYLTLPVTTFYARLGLIEPMLGLWILCFVISFEFYLKNKNNSAWLYSILFLTLSLLTKFTALMLVFIPVAYLVFTTSRDFYKSGWSVAKTLVLLDKKVLAIILVPFLVLGLFSLVYYLHDPANLKAQLKYILGYGPKRSSFMEILDTVRKFDRFFGLPARIFVFLGFFLLFKEKRVFVTLISYFFLLFMITSNPLSTEAIRYFACITAFFGLIAGASVWWFARKWGSVSYIIGFLVFSSLIIPNTYKAFWGSVHPSIKQTAQYLNDNYQDSNVFHNFWPTTFSVYNQNYKQTWVSDNSFDTNAFANMPGSHFVGLASDSKFYLNENGGIVVLKQPFFKHTSDDFGRERLANLVLERGERLVEFADTSNFYPFPDQSEKFGVYRVKPGVFDD